jgi:hypothetical protein
MNTAIKKYPILQNNGFLALPHQMISDEYILQRFKHKKVLSTDKNSNSKIAKSNKLGEYRTAYVSLLPGSKSGHNVCPNHKDCIDSCIGIHSGHNTFDNAILAKYYRTLYFSYYPEKFIAQLIREIHNFEKTCNRDGLKPAIRLNAYSDIPYEHKYPEIFEEFPGIQFYDYTKVLSRCNHPQLPSNYDLTYSLVSARHDFEDIFKIAQGMDVRCSAVLTRPFFDDLFKAQNSSIRIFNQNFGGFDLISGDNHDLTFIHDKGVVLGLRAKYKSKLDLSRLAYESFVS